MLLLAGMLKRGKIKLSGNSTNALSFFNPYKERGENVVEGLSGGGKPVDENVKQMTCQEMNEPGHVEMATVMKAMNTFHNVMNARTLGGLQSLGLLCNYMDNDDEDEFVMLRGLGVLQFVSLHDPWVAYMGSIQQKISS